MDEMIKCPICDSWDGIMSSHGICVTCLDKEYSKVKEREAKLVEFIESMIGYVSHRWDDKASGILKEIKGE